MAQKIVSENKTSALGDKKLIQQDVWTCLNQKQIKTLYTP